MSTNKLPLVFQRIAGAMQGVVEIGETRYSPQDDDGGCWLVHLWQTRKGKFETPWGRGRTLNEAVANCREQGGRMPIGKLPTKDVFVFWSPRAYSLSMDEFGRMDCRPRGTPVTQMWPPLQGGEPVSPNSRDSGLGRLTKLRVGWYERDGKVVLP